MQFTTKFTCQALDRDRKQQADDIATGHCGHVPDGGGNFRLWSADDVAAEQYFMDLRAEHYTVRLAGTLATRLRRAMTLHPDADQLALVTLDNGNRFAVPADQIDLTSGYSSGQPIREALIVDARNLRARVARLIEAAQQIVGEFDED
ncbi:hypothetical protein [Alteriqipengyuania lutimaris]|uniref:hypothetical protein n=1 Tax=Alteriqipengyuania lutimaris TaxID=1538146 RepID=UPI001CFE9E14|nr:hypothetical protein [Alteriqipengyuania lutimaris]